MIPYVGAVRAIRNVQPGLVAERSDVRSGPRRAANYNVEQVITIGSSKSSVRLNCGRSSVEGALAIGLLVRDKYVFTPVKSVYERLTPSLRSYRLLQITVVGVVLLHILLIPGVAFVTGGADIIEQELHSGKTQLNHTLLTLGVFALALPAVFFAALDRGNLSDLTKYVTRLNQTEHNSEEAEELASHVEYAALLSDERRGQFLAFSRGLAVLLLIGSVPLLPSALVYLALVAISVVASTFTTLPVMAPRSCSGNHLFCDSAQCPRRSARAPSTLGSAPWPSLPASRSWP